MSGLELILVNENANCTYNEDNVLKGYVITLQKFEKLLRDEEKDGSVIITTSTIETNKIFNI